MSDDIIQLKIICARTEQKLDDYIRSSTDRREICGKRFDIIEDRQWKIALALASLVAAWEWAKKHIGF